MQMIQKSVKEKVSEKKLDLSFGPELEWWKVQEQDPMVNINLVLINEANAGTKFYREIYDLNVVFFPNWEP